MPSFRRRESVFDADRVDEPPQDPDRAADAAQAQALAEEAEAVVDGPLRLNFTQLAERIRCAAGAFADLGVELPKWMPPT